MHPFVQQYQSVAAPKLKEAFKYESPYTIPRIEKVVVNMGIGETANNSGALDQLIMILKKITGQTPIQTKARIAVSGFKIRQGMVVGLKVTLRGERMQDFLQKFTNVALPRTRDFRGIPVGSITADGSLHIGIKDSMIFPEVAQENTAHSMQVTLVAKTTSIEEARLLYQSLGFIFQNN